MSANSTTIKLHIYNDEINYEVEKDTLDSAIEYLEGIKRQLREYEDYDATKNELNYKGD